MSSYNVVIFVLVISSLHYTDARDNARVPVTKFTNLQCESLDPSHIVYQECRLKLIKRGLAGLNIYIKLMYPVTNVLMNVDFYKKANGYKPFLFNFTVDFCKFMRNQVQNMPARILFKIVESYSNLNHTCPYYDSVIFKDLILSEDKFRLVPLPSGNYMLRMIFIIDNIKKAVVKAYYAREE